MTLALDRDAARVCVGSITAAHGVRGLVRVRPFTEDPAGVAAYGPVSDESGARRFDLQLLNRHKGQWIARLDGVTDRTAAEALAGTRLYVARDRLPAPEDADTFYHADLVGLAVRDPAGRSLGRVRAIHDFGAGDVIELTLDDGASTTLPFSRAAIPEIDLAAGYLVADLDGQVEGEQ